MKTVTSVTVWNDAVGKRMSVTYSVVDEETGKIIADNKRVDRVLTGQEIIELLLSLSDDELKPAAQGILMMLKNRT